VSSATAAGGAVHPDWRPTPFREFVLKVHARCNLACDYCYMYELADQSWRNAPKVMPERVLAMACERIGEHAARHRLASVRVVLHGGEPMLVGEQGLARIAGMVRAAVPSSSIVDILIHTNAVLLDERALDVLAEAGIRVGVSLDGDQTANDRHRTFRDGRSSFASVDRALRLLGDRPEMFSGILSVVDTANDPVRTYESVIAYKPSTVDFLLPHANWQTKPPGWQEGATPYGDWLVAVFDRWYGAPARETQVRFFDEIINLVAGRPSRSETIGLSPVATIVIDIDGAYEQIDTLRSTYPGAVDTGLNVFDHTLDEPLQHPDIVTRQLGLAALSTTCLSCPVHRICGGGYYPHRYNGSDFDNPSVYCADLRRLIDHVAQRIRADVDRYARADRHGHKLPTEESAMDAPLDSHRLSAGDITELGHGRGDAALIDRLRSGQLSRRNLMLRYLLMDRRSEAVRAAVDLLTRARRRAPAVPAGILALPHTGVWLTRALRVARGVIAAGSDPGAELSYLGWLSASAAIQAGLDFDLKLDVRDGVILLPGLGAAAAPGVTRVRVWQRGGIATVGGTRIPPDPATDADGWQGLRRLTSTADGLTLRLALDDLDPYRDGHNLAVMDRLPAADAARWQDLLDEAWPLLVRDHRAYAEGIAAGLSTIVPLRSERADRGMNATRLEAFGAVSLTRPPDAMGLALGLLHEFQHGKLGAVIDILPLYSRDATPRHYAPWRDDPRPIGALLQGAYAFQGVTDFWRVQRDRPGAGASQTRFAQVEFVRWRDRVWRTLDVLEESGVFNEDGRAFLAAMREAQRAWQGEQVPESIVGDATEAAEDHWVAWRLRNRRPEPDDVRRLAAAWPVGGHRAAAEVRFSIAPGERRLAQSARQDLANLRIVDPQRFACVFADPDTLAAVSPEASAGDVALAGGDHRAAAEHYTRAIVGDPNRLDDWVGLTLAWRRLGVDMFAVPELCRALYLELRQDRPDLDPLDVARWLAGVTSAAVPDRS
jgi:uncharacterized protein